MTALRSTRRISSAAKRVLIGFALLTYVTVYAADQVADAPGTPPAGQEQAGEPRYRVGESWLYRAKDKYFYSYSNPLDGDYEIDIQKGKPEFFNVDGEKKTTVGQPGHLSELLPTPGVRNRPSQLFNFPLWVGKQWKATYLAGKRWLSADNAVTGIETVTTPAGTFLLPLLPSEKGPHVRGMDH